MNLETLAIHAGQEADPTTGSMAVPIYQTASYVFEDTNDAAELFALKKFGNIYTRLMNPTTDVFEKRVALLEGGAAGLATASGQASITYACLNIAKPGDEIVSDSKLYGGTYNLLAYTFARLGIKVHFIETNNRKDFEKVINEKTKLIYTESIGNPKLDIADLNMLSDVAHSHNIPLIVDNTVPTPYLLKPIDHGADIIVHSATKFLGGHGTSIGGIIIDSGKFDWEKSGKFSEMVDPDPSYHGISYTESFKKLAFIIKARVQLLRDMGAAISPFNSFLILQGIETLHLRMQRHSENALAVAQYLKNHDKVSWVNYPGLEDNPNYELTKTYLPKGQGAIVGFGIKGGIDAGVKFIESLELISHLANIGDAKTLVIHPASTTHQQLSPEEKLKTGVTDDFIRLSVGIENIKDIISDIEQALSKV